MLSENNDAEDYEVIDDRKQHHQSNLYTEYHTHP